MSFIPRQGVRTSAFLKHGSFLSLGSYRLPLLAVNGISCNKSEPHQCFNQRPFSWSGWAITVSNSTPVHFFQESLLYFHDVSGLPWWSVILLSTIGIRSCVTLPLSVYQNHIVARLENIRNELKSLGPELNKEIAIAKELYSWDSKYSKAMFRKNMHRHYNRLVIRDNCHPFKSVILALFQVPVWICFSFSLRNVVYMMPVQDIAAYLNFLNLKEGGIWWFTDLTTPDAFFIPLMLGVVNLILIEMHTLRRIGKNSLLQKIAVNSMRLITVIVAAVACFNPSAVSFYWLCSSVFGLGQNILLLLPKVRRTLKIPKTPSESATPFQDIFRNLRTVLSK